MVTHFSRTQRTVSISSSEAEYVAVGYTVKEKMLARNVLRFMVPSTFMGPIRVVEDDQGSIKLTETILVQPGQNTFICDM